MKVDLIMRLEEFDIEPEELGDLVGWCKETGLGNIVGLLNAIATDRIVVVTRCKDCIHNEFPGKANPMCKIHYTSGGHYWFCADGKPREE